MRRLILLGALFFGFCLFSPSAAQAGKGRIILLVSEQNIEGPQRAWWASEVDLSTTEARIAQRLITEGYTVIEPSALTRTIKKDRAFRIMDMSQPSSIKLGRLGKADYLVVGKAVASSGGNIPQSNMRSCFANLSAKLIRVRDGKVIAYLDAAGNSAHLDPISGGKEALAAAADELSAKIAEALNKQGG